MFEKDEGPFFSHTGSVGDIIASLCAVKAAGGGSYGVYNWKYRGGAWPMNPVRYAQVAPLIEAQSYITKCEYVDTYYRDHPLAGFRQYLRRGVTLADAHLMALKLPLHHRNTAWIEVAEPIYDYPVIFNRTPRYHAERFIENWKLIHEKYRKIAVFVGMVEEHAAFEKAVGIVPHIVTPHMLQVSRMIAGCKLFVGNQSSCFNLAEGLKADVILEASPVCRDCVYRRHGFMWAEDDSHLELPEI